MTRKVVYKRIANYYFVRWSLGSGNAIFELAPRPKWKP